MAELTLEFLAARLTEVERKLHELERSKAIATNDWRSVVGMFDDDPGFLDVIEEGRAIRESDRQNARERSES